MGGKRLASRKRGAKRHLALYRAFAFQGNRAAQRRADRRRNGRGRRGAQRFYSKEHTCYYAKVFDDNLPLALDLLTDIFLHSSFDAEEIERERSVILQEISQAEDTPDDYVHDLFSLDFFKDHPIARPICGREETVTRFQREIFSIFLKSVTDRAASSSRQPATFATIDWSRDAELLGLVSDGAERQRRSTRRRTGAGDGQRALSPRQSLEQAHLCLGMAGDLTKPHPQRYTGYVLNTLLGGGMSSRLFQEIREKRGKAYSVYSFSSSYKDAGYFGVYAGTSLESSAKKSSI